MHKNSFSPPNIQTGQWFQILLCITALLVIGSIIYSNTLNSPFVFDDDGFILNDKNIRMTELTIESLSDAAFKGQPRHRLLPNISFAVNYYFGQYQVFGYHVFNIMVHLLTGILLFLFIRITLKIETWRTGTPPQSSSHLLIPFFAALIWLVHPVNTQAVTYICQRMASMVAMFYILSMLLYAYARASQRSASGYPIKTAMLFTGCILSGICAVASKENAGVLPLFILLYEWFFFQDLKPIHTNKRLVLIIGGMMVLFGAIAIIYLGENPADRILKSYKYRDFTLPQRVMTEFRVVIYYISLFLLSFPNRLNLEHDYPLSLSLADPWTTASSMIAIVFLIGLAVYTAKKNRLLSFCILWFFGNLLIESSVIGIEIIFEHRTYLPFMMIFFVFALTMLRYIKPKRLGIGLLCTITAVFSLQTFQRNSTWQNELSFYGDCVVKSPEKFRPHNNLGIALYDANQFDNAVKQYKKALQIDPYSRYAKSTFNNLGNAELKLYNANAAITHFSKALQIDPNFDKALNNMGNAFIQQKKYKKALFYFNKIIEQDHQNVEAHINIGVALTYLNRIDEAIEHYKTALEIYPFHAEIHNNLGVLLIHKNRLTEARLHFLKALELNPNYMSAKNNLKKLTLIQNNRTREDER